MDAVEAADAEGAADAAGAVQSMQQRVQLLQQRVWMVQWVQVQTWSSTTIRGSCSTATTFLQHSSSLSVRLPVPGPISRTVSVALIPAFSIIAAVTSGFLSKCCPSEWWSSTPACRYGAAPPPGAERSGFFSRPTLGISELAGCERGWTGQVSACSTTDSSKGFRHIYWSSPRDPP